MIDLLVLAYLAWGLFKGLRRGLGHELEALIKLLLLLAWLWGFGAFSWLRDTLDGLVQASPLSASMLGSLLVMLLSLLLLHLLRARLARAIDQRLSTTVSRLLGGITGVLRSGAWASALLLLAEKLPWIGATVQRSISGSLLQTLTG
jgi:uncharacterized membrane protein required for colicin V production